MLNITEHSRQHKAYKVKDSKMQCTIYKKIYQEYSQYSIKQSMHMLGYLAQHA